MLTMTVKLNPGIARRIQKRMEEAEAVALEAAIPAIRKVLLTTVGTQYYSLQMLATMHHPYSRARPNPPMPAGFINLQSGRFYESFVVTKPSKQGNRISISVYTLDEERTAQLYTAPRMIERPFIQLLRARLISEVGGILNEALRNAAKMAVR